MVNHNCLSIISSTWDGTGIRNPSLWKTMTHLSCIINAMTAGVLKTQGARVSAAIVLNEFFWNIPVSTPEGLRTHVIIHMNYREYGHIFSLVKTSTKSYEYQLCKGKSSWYDFQSRRCFCEVHFERSGSGPDRCNLGPICWAARPTNVLCGLCEVIWGLVCHKRVSRAWISDYIPQILWDVISYACPRYLFLTYTSLYYAVIIFNGLPIPMMKTTPGYYQQVGQLPVWKPRKTRLCPGTHK